MRIRWRYAAAAITLAFAALSVLPSDWLAPVYAAPVYAAPAKKGKKAAPKKDPPAQNAVVVDPLPYSLSYTITGNYRVGTVDFVPTETNGFQTDVIQMTGDSAVPPGATIVAAWLYWETIWGLPEEIEGAQFRGQDITLARGVDLPLSGSLSPCWSNGGGNLTMLRADVLSLLPDELGLDGNPTGRRLVNDADLTAAGLPLHTVTLPERGEGNQTPQSAGASLLVVYRLATEPLRRIVVFDGNHTHERGETTVQRIRGFLQSSAASADDAQLTYLAASGAPNKTDQILLSDADFQNPTLLATNPFRRAGGGSSDRAWSSSTTDVGLLMSAATVATDDPATPEDESRYGQQITTTLTHRKDNPYDCLAEAAIIFSTTVSDIEGDGIPDVLEVGSPFGGSGLIDPNGQEYPDLQAMGAVVGQRDFFAEINAMTAAPGTTYGSPTSPFKPGIQDVETDFSGHNHMPTPTVLRLVGEAQGRAGIAAHFDVGDPGAYKALD